MAELTPAPFADLVTRLVLEPQRQHALFELPRKRWWNPPADCPDMTVHLHGQPAGNPLGPAAGPHTQMAQNLLLSYIAGARILELKTVQINDHLTIGRPCIDITNIGYNIEWSQELRIEQSLREYVAGAMLIQMFRRLVAPGATADRKSGEHRRPAGASDNPHRRDADAPHFVEATVRAGDVIYDLSVGYDLAGIRSEKIRTFLDGMRDAATPIEQLRAEIPSAFAAARELAYPTCISTSITLSTFHGCPADEIERICEYLIGECGFDVIVKMNPPTLGREKLEHLLFDVLGYRELTVNPSAYESAMPMQVAVELCRRLTAFAAARSRRTGFKFSNTLEVLNHRDFFKPTEKVMYLSGQPLHVITMALTDEFRRAVGPDVPISFSAGIDKHNFPPAVACGFVPVTVSTDLLRPGGYGRMSGYLENLAAAMRRVGAATIDDYVVAIAREGGWAAPQSERDAQASAIADSGPVPGGAASPRTGAQPPAALAGASRSDKHALADPARCEVADRHVVAAAALRNTSHVAELARNDPRYRAAANRGIPKRIDSQLETFDCITCDKCLPVCPNAANFKYPTPIVAFEYHDVIVEADGSWRFAPETRRFEITETMQIACYADFCNECGNCDTFCPEYGGPYIKKPTFFGSERTWATAAPRDGFVIDQGAERILGRIRGREYRLIRNQQPVGWVFADDVIGLRIDPRTHEPTSVEGLAAGKTRRVDMWGYHVLRHLLTGVGSCFAVNQVNAAWVIQAPARQSDSRESEPPLAEPRP
ncbi:putative selenate reductase subunit YgfK [Phycisphaerae bacterium RAS1]|nr:putative selenate reductase subunit YgfK [Phycisphaerae bacterium RAS1]